MPGTNITQGRKGAEKEKQTSKFKLLRASAPPREDTWLIPAGWVVVLALSVSALADEPGVLRLTHDGHLKQRPAWSPDGAWLAFTRHQGATIFLFLRSADGVTEKRLTSRKDPEFDAVWSPDGK